jgi:hypothetical protein
MPRLKPRVQTVTVDGVEYRWSYRHEWMVHHGRGLKDVSVSVSLDPGRTRELILDLEFKISGIDRQLSDAALGREIAAAIRTAIENGWDPESRGRPFRHQVYH